MSARRNLGEYTLIMKWAPSRGPAWIVGDYRWSIRRAGRNRGGDDGWLLVYEDTGTSRRAGEVTPADLGIEPMSPKKNFQTRAAYDAAALIIVRSLLGRRPNDHHYQELLAHAYVNAFNSGAIDNNDLASAPERTQMLIDQLLGVT